MAKSGFTKVENGIEDGLTAMIERGKSLSSYMNRVLFRQFQKAQIERFQTENSSEGNSWQELSQPYKTQKRSRFASYPGAGNAIMIATGKLSQGAMGRDPNYFFKLITDKSFEVSMNTSAIPYSIYPGVMRPYMSFSQDRIKSWTKGIQDYMTKGVERE